jgi:hypothetical protein
MENGQPPLINNPVPALPAAAPAAAPTGNKIIIFIGVLFVLGGLAYLYYKNRKTCVPTAAQTVENANTYIRNTTGNCVVANCLNGYMLSNTNTCVKNVDCELNFDYKVLEGENKCSKTPTIKVKPSGNGAACGPIVPENVDKTDSTCKILSDTAANKIAIDAATIAAAAATAAAAEAAAAAKYNKAKADAENAKKASAADGFNIGLQKIAADAEAEVKALENGSATPVKNEPAAAVYQPPPPPVPEKINLKYFDMEVAWNDYAPWNDCE